MSVHNLLSPRLFKKASGKLQSPPSVRPSRYLLLNHWTKSNQVWCVSCSHEWGVQRHIFFGPAPWGPGEGPKGQIFFNQTLYVFSHMKDIKHIRRDFHLAPGGPWDWDLGVPWGWDLGVPWGVGGSKHFFSEIQPDLVCESLK